MRELKPKRRILAVGLVPFEQGDVFEKWPLHITLVPWFSEAKPKKLLSELPVLAKRWRPIEARLGNQALFGSSHDVPVWTIAQNPKLQDLHNHLLAAVHESGGNPKDLSHISYMYRPHITTRQNQPLPSEFVINNFALITDLGDNSRRVEEIYELRA